MNNDAALQESFIDKIMNNLLKSVRNTNHIRVIHKKKNGIRYYFCKIFLTKEIDELKNSLTQMGTNLPKYSYFRDITRRPDLIDIQKKTALKGNSIMSYIVIKVYDCDLELHKDYYGWELKPYSEKKYLQDTFFIYDDKSFLRMVGERKSTKRRYSVKCVPATIKDMINLDPKLLKCLMMCFSDNLFYKDILNENISLPVKFSDLNHLHTKKDYLEKIFKISLIKSINKYKFSYSYNVCCCAKYIKNEQLSLLLLEKNYKDLERDSESILKSYGISIRNRRSIATEFLAKYFYLKFKFTLDYPLIEDFINMSIIQKQPIDLTIGKKHLIKEHNLLSIKFYNKKGGKNIVPNTPLKFLNLPKEFILLDTPQKLAAEGIKQHNCVASYEEKIKQGICIIYHADINNESLTIEIRYKKLKNRIKFFINQCYIQCNDPCSKETYDYVEKCLNESSKTTLESFNLFQNKNERNKL